MKDTFTPVEDWLARRKDLSAFEKLLIAKIKRYGLSGCFMGSRNLGKSLGVDFRTVQKTIADLIREGWLAPLYPTKYKRILYVSEEKLAEIEPDLFAQQNSQQNSQDIHKVRQVCAQSTASCRTPSMIHRRENKIQRLIDSVSEIMRDAGKPISKAEFEKRKNQMLEQLKEQP